MSKSEEIVNFVNLNEKSLKVNLIPFKQCSQLPSLKHRTLGIDPGSTYDGFSIVNTNTSENLLNVELIHRAHKDKNAIKAFKSRQSSNRRLRRSRLRMRPVRFDNRTSSKLTPTIRSQVDFRVWLICKLSKYYNITNVIIEDVKFNHYKSKKGFSFSQVEQGKNYLYDWIKSHNYNLELSDGICTYSNRNSIFGEELKENDKSKESFYAHCIDSFIIAGGCDKSKVNTNVIFIEKIVKQRRYLFRERALYNNSKYYFRYSKGGKVKIIEKLSKRKKVRIKIDDRKSNHGKIWNYMYTEQVLCEKRFVSRYGGTSNKKFFNDSEWENRRIWKVA